MSGEPLLRRKVGEDGLVYLGKKKAEVRPHCGLAVLERSL